MCSGQQTAVEFGIDRRRILVGGVFGWASRLVAIAVLVFATSANASAQVFTLNAHPGPANNGGNPDWGIFFDLTSTASLPLIVSEMTTASTAAAGASYSIEVFTRVGSGLGGPVSSGPGSSPAGWTSLGIASATQGPVASQVSEPISIPNIMINPGETVGVAVVFTGVGPRYFGTGTPPHETYSDPNLQLVTGDARSQPFTTAGTFFSSRQLVGSVTYEVVPEPTSAVLLSMMGLCGLALARRRRT